MAIDLDTATADELDAADGLRGHGFEATRYREERGRFTDVRQLARFPDWRASSSPISARRFRSAAGSRRERHCLARRRLAIDMHLNDSKGYEVGTYGRINVDYALTRNVGPGREGETLQAAHVLHRAGYGSGRYLLLGLDIKY